MKNKKVWLGVLVLVLGLMVVGCDDGSTKYNGPDFVKIESVTPSTDLVEGIEQQFSVTVNYGFSFERGTIAITFNTDEINAYIRYAFIDIKNGSGKHTLNAAVIPKNWLADGDFEVMAILLNSKSIYSLAYDKKVLTFKQINFFHTQIIYKFILI